MATDQRRPDLPRSWVESERFVPRTFVQPALNFMRNEAAGGVLMLLAAVVAIVWANSPAGESYFAFFGATIEIGFGQLHLHHLSELTVQEWINDALMAIFFFVVGLEIKRELVVGELRDPRSAALPAVAAIGGMVVPALIYVAFNADTTAVRGWGIPMATDIAFAIGIVSMAGRRVPIAAKLFLLALAIVDDLGAILVIAIFYTDDLAFGWLVAAAVGLLLVFTMNRVGVRSTAAYVLVGIGVWVAVLESGVHATVAGVALALLTPVIPFYSPTRFGPEARALVERIEGYLPADPAPGSLDHHTLDRVDSLLSDLRRLARESLPPLDRLESALAPWASFVVVPVFALANAGVEVSGAGFVEAAADPVFLGIGLGLLVGKTLGVTGFAWLAVRLGIGRMPHRTTWHHMIGMAMLSGIGFTVALFVAALSFASDSPFADDAKLGIFAASLVAGSLGYVWLRFLGPSPEELDRNHDGVLDTRQGPGHSPTTS